MKYYIFYCLIMFLSVSCSNFQDNGSIKKLRTIEYRNDLTDTYSDGKKSHNKQFIYINYFNHCILYEVPIIEYKFKTSVASIQNYSVEFNQEIKSIDTTYKYFIFKRKSKTGLNYYGTDLKEKRVFKIDSLYNSLGINKENREIYDINYLNPVEIRKNAYTGKIEFEKFIDKNETTKLHDTIYRYYSPELNWVEFSIADEIDKRRNTKLSKYILVLLNNNNSKQTGNYCVKTELCVQIINKKNPNNQKILELFRRFEVDNK